MSFATVLDLITPNAVDMSKWGGDFTREEAECCIANGVTTFILGTGPGGYGSQVKLQADDIAAVGGILEVYYFIEWGYPDADGWIQAGKDALGDFAPLVKRVWVDVEDTNQNTIPATLAERWAYADRYFEAADRLWSTRAGYYGARWYHVPYLGNTDRWSDRQLFNGYYDGNPDISGLPYGGWTQADVAIEQYMGTTLFCDQSVDLDWVYKLASGGNTVGASPKELELIVKTAEALVGLADEGNALQSLINRVAPLSDAPLYPAIQNQQGALTQHINNHPGGTPPPHDHDAPPPHDHPATTVVGMST